jgi:hypothetical protein
MDLMLPELRRDRIRRRSVVMKSGRAERAVRIILATSSSSGSAIEIAPAQFRPESDGFSRAFAPAHTICRRFPRHILKSQPEGPMIHVVRGPTELLQSAPVPCPFGEPDQGPGCASGCEIASCEAVSPACPSGAGHAAPCGNGSKSRSKGLPSGRISGVRYSTPSGVGWGVGMIVTCVCEFLGLLGSVRTS